MKYSIKDLETISGIKAHTIRAWELRYNIFTPYRDNNNTRLYTTEELKYLLNIAFLNKKGFKISVLATHSPIDIGDKVVQQFSIENNTDVIFHHWLLATIQMDEALFEQILSESLEKYGLENTLIDSLFPFMQKIGHLWHAGFVASSQEHFITNLIRRKIISAIDSLPLESVTTSYEFLLYLPEGEWHELALLFSHYIIKSRGHKVIYLGQSVPWEDLEKIGELKKPDFIVTVITFPKLKEELDFYLIRLSEYFSSSKILIAGQYIDSKQLPYLTNLHLLKGPSDLLCFL